MSNRVEELESKVSELQAAVNGLTEELVETKERVRELEDERGVAVEAEDEGSEAAPGDTGSEIMEPTPTSAESGALDDGDAGAGDGAGDDDAVKTEEREGSDNEESEDSDIIVA